MDSLFSILKIYRILLNFHSLHMYIDPEQLYVINSFLELCILYARLRVTKNSPKFATCSVGHNFMTY